MSRDLRLPFLRRHYAENLTVPDIPKHPSNTSSQISRLASRVFTASATEKGSEMLQKISTIRFSKPSSELNAGPAPQQLWLKIEDLVVDRSYQREIGKRGASNIIES